MRFLFKKKKTSKGKEGGAFLFIWIQTLRRSLEQFNEWPMAGRTYSLMSAWASNPKSIWLIDQLLWWWHNQGRVTSFWRVHCIACILNQRRAVQIRNTIQSSLWAPWASWSVPVTATAGEQPAILLGAETEREKALPLEQKVWNLEPGNTLTNASPSIAGANWERKVPGTLELEVFRTVLDSAC